MPMGGYKKVICNLNIFAYKSQSHLILLKVRKKTGHASLIYWSLSMMGSRCLGMGLSLLLLLDQSKY
jgi:hypothetical protein